MIFRTLCEKCAQEIEERAALSEQERDTLIIGCAHNKVGATVLVNGGMIVGWNMWPVNNEAEFNSRAAAQLVLLHEFMNPDGADDSITKH